MPNPILILLEAIALTVIGSVAHVVRAKISKISDIADNLVLAVVVGIACFAKLGEPSDLTVVPYLIAGYAAGEFVDWIFKPWWNTE